ncbi:hypothetical protein ACSBR1_017692 [Camellia fascicularis]
MVEKELKWTTLEELLLACAVKRHGHKNWDSVVMELQNRTSFSPLLTAPVCRNKYYDLKRRFMDEHDDDDKEVDTIPWIEELRKLRVAELKQELHRYDLSIHSLQSKVKRLEEERERSLKENENDDEKPDLEKDLKEERSENEKNDGPDTPEKVAVGGSDRSVNESNSAAVNEERRDAIEAGDVKPDPASSDSKPAGADSYNDSTDTVAKHAAAKTSQEEKGGGDPAELRRDMAAAAAGESKEGTKESSDVQSTASLTRKRHREKEVSGGSSGGGGDEPVVSPATTIKRGAVKSEPLVGLLDIIRSHKHGSMFERRLESQKTDEYKSMIRHHVDLETIRNRLDKGSYSTSTTKFHRDLLLLFNNALVFFPKASPESVAAIELRDLITKEMIKKKKTQRYESSPEPGPSKKTALQPKPKPKPKPKSDTETFDSLLAKHKSSVPLIVCRKRSSISAKVAEKQKPSPMNPKPPVKTCANVDEEKENLTKVKMKEKPVTGTRSFRRSSSSSKGHTDIDHERITKPSSKNASGSAEKGEALKAADKKKNEVAVKKQGAADFLKRIKRNSPLSKGTVLNNLVKSKGSDANGGGRKEEKKRGKEAPPVTTKRSGSVVGKRRRVVKGLRNDLGGERNESGFCRM